MDDELKQRWKRCISDIDRSGMTKCFIAKKVGISNTAIYCLTAVRRGGPAYPQYATDRVISKLEKFFNEAI